MLLVFDFINSVKGKNNMYVNHKPCAYSTQKRNDPDGLFESHFVPATVYNSGIAGWYIYPSDMDWPENAAWNNRGNGPEITHDEIHGPFRSEAKAWVWLGRQIGEQTIEKYYQADSEMLGWQQVTIALELKDQRGFTLPPFIKS